MDSDGSIPAADAFILYKHRACCSDLREFERRNLSYKSYMKKKQKVISKRSIQ